MDQYIGKLLDNRYELLELIGIGGMARVYKARCHRLNRLVAVKILREDMAQDAEVRRRFHDESQAVAMLSHPNIMAVYDVSRSSDLLQGNPPEHLPVHIPADLFQLRGSTV